jgi:hypothetical protein
MKILFFYWLSNKGNDYGGSGRKRMNPENDKSDEPIASQF